MLLVIMLIKGLKYFFQFMRIIFFKHSGSLHKSLSYSTLINKMLGFCLAWRSLERNYLDTSSASN